MLSLLIWFKYLATKTIISGVRSPLDWLSSKVFKATFVIIHFGELYYERINICSVVKGLSTDNRHREIEEWLMDVWHDSIEEKMGFTTLGLGSQYCPVTPPKLR